LLLDVGSGNDLSGEVKPFAEVVETLGGQGVVVVLPRELGLDIAARVERLQSLDNEQVLGVDIGVLGKVEVLLGDENTLTEEVLAETVSYVRSLHCTELNYAARNSPPSSLRNSNVLVITSWIFLRSALGINIVAVFAARRKGRCWKMAGFGGEKQLLKMITFCGRTHHEIGQ
jgi:hypothetical protein